MKGTYYPVLDHGFVGLVDYMGDEAAIDQAARVSYGNDETRKVNDIRGLLRYLFRNKHTSPFEMVDFKFHLAMPIFVARQWMRHRTASINEYSGRYSVMPPLFYLPQLENIKYQSKSNHQGGDLVMENDIASLNQDRMRMQNEETFLLYDDFIVSDGMAKETAREILPLSTYTTFYWKINLHNLLHFLTLRVHDHSQWEIREYANVLAGYVKKIVPLVYEAWVDYTVVGESFSAQELQIIRELIYKGKGGGLYSDTKCITDADVTRKLPNSRERNEFMNKLTFQNPIDFSLDESQTMTGEQAKERMRVN